MRVLPPILLALVLGCATARPPPEPPPAPPPPPPWTPTPPPPAATVPPLQEPPVRELTLYNGLRVVIVEHHRRPLVAARLFFNGGAAADPDDTAGATLIAVEMLGGAFDPPGEGEPDDPVELQVAEAGARFIADVDQDNAWIGIEGHARETGRYLKMLLKIVDDPRRSILGFEARAEAARFALQDAKQSPADTFADYVVRRAFGAKSPYSRSVLGTPDSLGRLTFDEVVQRQRELVQPKGSTLLIAGDVKADELLGKVERLFASWRPQGAPPRTEMARAKKPRPEPGAHDAAIVARPVATGTMVCAARPLVTEAVSDAAAQVLTRVLERRLTQALREERGLTYDVSTALAVRRRARALVVCSTLRTEELAEGLKLFTGIIASAGSEKVLPAKLEWAKATAATAERSGVVDLSSIVDSWTGALNRGEQLWAIQPRVDAIVAVSEDDVVRAAQALTSGPPLEWVLSGNPAKIRPAIAAGEPEWNVVQVSY